MKDKAAGDVPVTTLCFGGVLSRAVKHCVKHNAALLTELLQQTKIIVAFPLYTRQIQFYFCECTGSSKLVKSGNNTYCPGTVHIF